MPQADLHLLYAALAIAALIVGIVRWKIHPFLALSLVALALGVACGIAPDQAVVSFERGFGDVAGHIGIIVALGVILGGILVSSGAASLIATSLLGLGSASWMPWTMCGAALLIGLPLFFEVSLVLLTPISFALAALLQTPQLRLGIPMLAGIIGAHALLPPHPAPSIAVAAFGADAGKTLLLGLIVAVPALAVSGPLWAAALFRWFPRAVSEPKAPVNLAQQPTGEPNLPSAHRTASLFSSWAVILLAPALMLLRSGALMVFALQGRPLSALNFIGDPVIALLAALGLAIALLWPKIGRWQDTFRHLADSSLAGAAGIILITGAGGGLKQILIDTQVGDVLVSWALQAHVSPLVLAWLAAATLRVTIGTSTVATLMTSGLLAPLVAKNPTINRELMVLATGCGSVFGSHVNDPGFWFIKQYFNLSLGATFRSWTVLTILLSVTGLGVLSLLSRCLG